MTSRIPFGGQRKALMVQLEHCSRISSSVGCLIPPWLSGVVSFGRTVTAGGGAGAPGRDHNGRAMCSWMAGGGVKGGTTYGATDEFGGRSVENKMHIHDLHATILALMGFDHTKLTYNYNGREFRLTDNFGNVVKDLIA